MAEDDRADTLLRRFGLGEEGVDHSPEMVALARGRAPGAQVTEAAAEALPFADATFHAVTMCTARR